MTWNPAQYLQYEGERLRPALDLIGRIPLATPRRIVDLGCGAGNVAQMLAARWPAAHIEGIDGDAAMLARARAATAGDPRYSWTHADLNVWRPAAGADLIFSNAALHWLDGHAQLFPRLAAALAPGGVLAVQMPDNFGAPSHVTLFETARSERWVGRLGAVIRAHPVAPLAHYHHWLAPQSSALDVWRTTYLQALKPRADGEHPVVAWNRGAALTPFLAALSAAECAEFVADYAAQVAPEYPADAHGAVLYPFSRMFIVARRSGHLTT
jgi:trans-aconitate 2-methyltransferase